MDGLRQGLSGERRVLTSLFCDIVGSTARAETMDPEDWGEIIAAGMRIVGGVIERFGGTVSEFAGDGLLAIFGAPVAHEDDPYRAVRAGLEIVKASQTHRLADGDRLQVRVGIHTGLAVVGDIETSAFRTYSALGDALNVAARLQSMARPGTVVITAATLRLLGSDVEVTSLGATDLKGRTASISAYQVEGVKEAAERRRGLPGLSSPMVGRSTELNELERLVGFSAAGTGRIAAVMGEPGVGKTRLVEELEPRLAKRPDARWALGTCVPFDEDLPYHLVAGLVRSLAGVGSTEAPSVAGKAILALCQDLDIGEHEESLLRLIDVEGEYDDRPAEVLEAEYVEAVSHLLGELSRESRPIVLVCEDVHWADPSSVDLMAEMLNRVPTLPVMLVLAMRPDRSSVGWTLLELARRDIAEALTEIRLQPLDDATSREMVGHLLEIESLPPSLRRLVLDKAEGNPFFLEEVVRMLVARDLVVRRDGRWIAKGDLSSLDVPATIQGLLASRIDMLGADLRKAGRVAAVIGRRFSVRLFDEVFDERPQEERGTLHPDIAALEAQGILSLESVDPELEFGFRHALIHDVMCEGLLRKERRTIHREVAAAIVRLYGDRLEEMAPSLARHYAEAGDVDDALVHLFVAGRRAMSLGARREAAGFFGQAQRLLESDPDADPSMQIDAVLGRLNAGSGFTPGPEALGWIESVLPLAHQLDDPDRLARLYERAIWTRSMQGETYARDEYRAQLDAGYSLIPRLTDAGTAALLEAMMGAAHRSGDEYEASVEPLTHAVDRLEDAGRLVEASYNASMLADSLSQIGRFDEAMDVVTRAGALGRASGDPNAILDADLIRGSIAGERGDLEEALELTKRGIEAAESVGNTFCNLAGNFKLADQELRLGNVESAITHLETSTGLAQFCDAGGYEALGQAWLAAARSRAGDLRVADFDGPLAAAICSGSRSAEGLVRMQRGIALAGAGRFEDATPDFERAIELFADYGGLPNLARAHHAFGQALEAAGQGNEATEHLHEARRLFEELGIRHDGPMS